jgi:hypothetical protein
MSKTAKFGKRILGVKSLLIESIWNIYIYIYIAMELGASKICYLENHASFIRKLSVYILGCAMLRATNDNVECGI